MAKAKAQQDDAQQEDEVQPVDQYGQPLPLVVMVTKDGVEVPVRDATGLSVMHYTHGLEFAESGMTYAKALAVVLGENAGQYLIQVPAESEDPGPSSEPDGTTSG